MTICNIDEHTADEEKINNNAGGWLPSDGLDLDLYCKRLNAEFA
jgi:hypothetical protein